MHLIKFSKPDTLNFYAPQVAELRLLESSEDVEWNKRYVCNSISTPFYFYAVTYDLILMVTSLCFNKMKTVRYLKLF